MKSKLPQECWSLIFSYDSTYHEYFQNKVLMLHKKSQSEFLFYQQIVESRYKNNTTQKNLMVASAAINDIIPLEYELKISLLFHLPSTPFQYCEMQYEQEIFHVILWPNCPLSLEQFVAKYMEEVDPRYASSIHVDSFAELGMNTCRDCFPLYKYGEKRKVTPSKKLYIECEPNYYLSLCLLPDNTVAIHFDYNNNYTFIESQQLEMSQEDYEENVMIEFLDTLCILRENILMEEEEEIDHMYEN